MDRCSCHGFFDMLHSGSTEWRTAQNKCCLDWSWLIPHHLGSARTTNLCMSVHVDTLYGNHSFPAVGQAQGCYIPFPCYYFPPQLQHPVLFSCCYKAPLPPPVAAAAPVTLGSGKFETHARWALPPHGDSVPEEADVLSLSPKDGEALCHKHACFSPWNPIGKSKKHQ